MQDPALHVRWLSWFASPRTGLQMQCTPRGKHFQLLHRKRPKQKVKLDHRNATNLNRRQTLHQTLVSHFSFLRSMAPRKHPPPASLSAWRRKGGTCHFAQGPEPHPPDTCQAGAETPPGFPPLAPEPRPLSPSSRRSVVVGDRGESSSRRDTAGAETRPRLNAGVPAPTHSQGALLSRRPPRLHSLTWAEASPQGRCPARGPLQEGAAAAAAPGVRRPQRQRRRLRLRLLLRLCGGFWAA